MKTIDDRTTKSNEEIKRYKGRLSYYENKLGLSHDEAVRRAQGGGKVASPNPEPVPGNGQPVLTPWQQRQQKKKAGQIQPLETDHCPKCGARFLIKFNDDPPEPVGLNYCPNKECSIRFYFAQ